MLALGISTVAGPGIMPVGAAGNNRVMNVERGTPLTEHRDSAPRGLTPGRAAGPASPASSASALASCQGTWNVVPSPNGSGHQVRIYLYSGVVFGFDKMAGESRFF